MCVCVCVCVCVSDSVDGGSAPCSLSDSAGRAVEVKVAAWYGRVLTVPLWQGEGVEVAVVVERRGRWRWRGR